MRETKYTDLTKTKERKKFIWLCAFLIILTIVSLCLSSFILAATKQDIGSHVHVHFKPADYLEYTTNSDKTLTVKGFKADLVEQPTDLVIPAEYKGQTVTAIAANAFNGNEIITKVTIPETITSIGFLAFGHISNLKEINYNAINVSAYSSAFNASGQNAAYTNAIIGENVTVLPELLFCYNYLDEVEFLGNKLTTLEDECFDGVSRLKELVLPDGLEKLYYHSIAFCKDLQKLVIPESVTSFDNDAISNNGSNLTVYLNAIDTSINNFSEPDYAIGAYEVVIGKNVKAIGRRALESEDIKSVTIESVDIYIVAAECDKYGYNGALDGSLTYSAQTIKVPTTIVKAYDNSYLEDTSKFSTKTEGSYTVFTKL